MMATVVIGALAAIGLLVLLRWAWDENDTL
jgi:hypothetical protein